MNLDQMLYLVELEKTKTISQAANNLNISQAGLSQSLEKLESELGIRVFDRTRKGISTTKSGEQIIKHAKEIEKQLGIMRKIANAESIEVSPPLKFGVMNEVPSSLLDWLLKFQEMHPGFKVSLTEASSEQIITGIKDRTYDVGLIAIDRSHYHQLNSLDFKKIGHGEFKLFMTANHYLADYPDPIPVDLLREQEFALFIDEYIDEFINRLGKEYGPLNITVRSTSFRVVLETMRKFQAVSIIRDSQIQDRLYDLAPGDLVEHELSSLNQASNTKFQYGLINLPSGKFTDLQRTFIQGIRNIGMD